MKKTFLDWLLSRNLSLKEPPTTYTRAWQQLIMLLVILCVLLTALFVVVFMIVNYFQGNHETANRFFLLLLCLLGINWGLERIYLKYMKS